ncbi:MAG: 30S ribosomal protein S8 [Holosporaceae bacterium]|jgi:small subunit ribosomal protein S8|nr:30S ribosomal protein S8 [Holosporaceae bacterium]
MMTDPIADMFARIKNAGLRRFKVVDVPSSRAKSEILRVLEKEGYINGFQKATTAENRSVLRIDLRYYGGKPVINALDRVSKPSRRLYSKVKKIGSVHNGFGIQVLSTSKGVMSDAEARELNVGGEIICRVF